MKHYNFFISVFLLFFADFNSVVILEKQRKLIVQAIFYKKDNS